MSKTVNNADQINAVITTNGDATASVDFTPTQDTHVVNKAYVDTAIGNIPAPVSVANPNLLINGGFDVWQRGTDFPEGSQQYTADRFKVDSNCAVIRLNAEGQPNHVPSQDFAYSARITPTAGSVARIFTSVELTTANVTAPFKQNQDYTLSFYAKTFTLGSNDLRLYAAYANNAFGTNASVIVNNATIATLTNGWARYEYTFNTGTIAPNSGNLCFAIILTAVTTDDGIELTGVKLEQGSVATPWFYEDYGTTLAKCQRYFYKLVIASGNFGFPAFRLNTNWIAYTFKAPVTMRKTPAYSNDGTPAQFYLRGNATNEVFDNPTSYITAPTGGTDIIGLQKEGLTADPSVSEAYIILMSPNVEHYFDAEI